MRKPIIAGNWKLNKKIGEAVELVNALKRDLADVEAVDILVCPAATALAETADAAAGSNIAVGAQNLFWEESGAWTGEVSALLIKDAGCGYVIIGHSERRQYFAETNRAVNLKLKAALKEGLIPIVCVGEKLEERESGETFNVVESHIVEGLKDISNEDAAKIIIAYEPVWAIGTGKTATPEQAQEVHKFMRVKLSELFGKEVAEVIRIQYGGSVKPDNTVELMKCEDIDGALVGGASLKAESFSEIVRRAIAS